MSALSYSNALPNRLVSYDDYMLVLENEPVKQARVCEILTRPLKGTYLPLRALSYAADHALWGMRPVGYHLTNLLLHTANSALVLLVLRAAGLGLLAATLGAGLFAAHAVHTEAVTWAAGRRDVLFVFFYLVAFLSYVRFRKRGSRAAYTAAAAAYLMATLSKGMAVTFFPTIIAWDWSRGELRRRRAWGYAKSVAPMAAITVGMAAVHFALGCSSGAIRAYHGGSLASSLWATAAVIASYARLLLVPVNLCASYYFDPAWQPSLAQALAGAALVLGGAVASLKWRRHGFWFWWMLLNLLTVLNFVPLSTLEAERYLYLPSVGAVALLALCAVRGAGRGRVAGALFCLALSAQAALACHRNFDWRDSATLWRSTLAASPANPKAVGELALIAQSTGRLRRAEAGYRRAISLDPKLPRPYLNLGTLYESRGRLALAERQYRAAIARRPDYAKAHVNLGLLLLRAGRLEEAEREARLALALDPAFVGSVQLHRAVQARRRGGRP